MGLVDGGFTCEVVNDPVGMRHSRATSMLDQQRLSEQEFSFQFQIWFFSKASHARMVDEEALPGTCVRSKRSDGRLMSLHPNQRDLYHVGFGGGNQYITT